MISRADQLAILEALGETGIPASLSPVEAVRALVAENARMARLLEERAHRKPLEGLLEQLDERQSDLLLLIADACLDEGRTEEAKGWAWLGRHRKWPTWCDFKKSWLWYRILHGYKSDSLPIPLGRVERIPLFRTQRQALEWVVDLIASKEWVPEG